METATELHSKIIRSIGYCASCGKRENLECAHIIGRSSERTRTDLNNGICLCHTCHDYFTRNPLAWRHFVARKRGQDTYDKLRRIAFHYARTKHPVIDWKHRTAFLKKLWKDIQAGKQSPQLITEADDEYWKTLNNYAI